MHFVDMLAVVHLLLYNILASFPTINGKQMPLDHSGPEICIVDYFQHSSDAKLLLAQ